MISPTPAHLGAVREAVLAGDIMVAATALGQILSADPNDYEARYWLASALEMAGDAAGATLALEDARTRHTVALARSIDIDVPRCSRDGPYAEQVANALYSQHHVAMASLFYGMALSAGHVTEPGLLGYGLSLQHQGRVEESIQAFRAAVETFPSSWVHQFLLYPHLLVSDPRRYADEARQWASLYAPAGQPRPFASSPSAGRKLRIGYVAPSFATTQVRQFLAPVFAAHDPDEVEVFLYPTRAETETELPAWLNIHPIGHLSDADAAETIRADRIDVLADCWGHSAGSRLPVFALRPAPVQVAWINFVQTTGLKQIDYILHADSDLQPDLDGQFTESIWTIGPVFNTFRPAEDRPEPSPTPALANGFVTFGSFNHPCKLSDEAVLAWARILVAAPSSRLFLKYSYFVDPVLQRVTQARFAASGVAPERILFEGATRGAEYLAAFAKVDLALDTAPAPGATTTLEALSNGVPVLILAGAPLTLRGLCTSAMVKAVGLPELASDGWDDYVRRAVALTADPEALNQLRAKVRPGFDNGPLRDGIGFTRRIEAAFREMFERSREADRRPPSPAEAPSEPQVAPPTRLG